MNRPHPTPDRQPRTPKKPAPHDDHTSLPGLRTWPRVYVFVVASFILWVVSLLVLTRMFT